MGKTEYIPVRLTPPMAARVREEAAKHSETTSDVIRRCIAGQLNFYQ